MHLTSHKSGMLSQIVSYFVIASSLIQLKIFSANADQGARQLGSDDHWVLCILKYSIIIYHYPKAKPYLLEDAAPLGWAEGWEGCEGSTCLKLIEKWGWSIFSSFGQDACIKHLIVCDSSGRGIKDWARQELWIALVVFRGRYRDCY